MFSAVERITLLAVAVTPVVLVAPLSQVAIAAAELLVFVASVSADSDWPFNTRLSAAIKSMVVPDTLSCNRTAAVCTWALIVVTWATMPVPAALATNPFC